MSVRPLMDVLSNAQLLEAAAAAFAGLRLFHLGLFRSQSVIAAYVLFSSFALAVLAFLSPQSDWYFAVYSCSVVTVWLLEIGAVRQVFSLLLGAYRGLQSLSRWLMGVALTLAIAGSIIVSGAAWREGAHGHSPLLFYIESLNRSLVLTLAIFIAIFLLLMSRYPLHLQRNTMISCAFFGAIFIAEALSTLVDTLSPRLYSVPVDIAHIFVSAACFVLWGCLLRRNVPPPPPPPVDRGQGNEERLLRELESLNGLLSRAGRR